MAINQTPPMFPQDGGVDDYVQMLRNQRLAQMLNQEAQSPIDYDKGGFISSGQLLAKGLAGAGSLFANRMADEDTAKAAVAKNQQMKQMFGAGAPASGATPQALGAALGGQKNSLASGFDSPEQAMYMYQNNPDLYKEIVGKNLQLTENQKNYGGQLGAFNDATIAEKRAQGIKTVNAGDTAVNMNNGQQFVAPKLLDIQAGDRHVLGNQTTGGFQQTGTVVNGMTPDAANRPTAQPNGGLSPDALKAAGARFNIDMTLPQGIPRNSSGAVAIMNEAAAQRKINNISPEDAAKAQITGKQDIAGNSAIIKSYDSGADHKNITSLNTQMEHAIAAKKAFDAWNAGDTAIGNKIAGSLGVQIGSDTGANYKALQLKLHTLGDETANTLSGGKAGVTDRSVWENLLPDDAGPEVMNAGLNTIIDLGHGRLNALETGYNVTGRKDFPSKYLSGNTQSEYLKRYPRQESSQVNPAQGASDLSAQELARLEELRRKHQ